VKIGFLEYLEYLETYGIQMNPSVAERSRQSGKKPALCTLGLLSTNIRERERSDQNSGDGGKIALANEHN